MKVLGPAAWQAISRELEKRKLRARQEVSATATGAAVMAEDLFLTSYLSPLSHPQPHLQDHVLCATRPRFPRGHHPLPLSC